MIKKNRFEGDPALELTEDGAEITFKGGQPIMDRGLANMALISLFTHEGWIGNGLLPDRRSRIGSKFENQAQGPITLTRLNDIRQSVAKALNLKIFGDITAQVQNPKAQRIDVTITLGKALQSPSQISVSRENGNWIYQKLDPAHRRLNG